MSESLVVEAESHSADGIWLQENWESIVKHPRDIIKNAIPLSEFHRQSHRGGVYFLLAECKIVYVGMSGDSVKTRIACHAKKLPFDAVGVIPLSCCREYIMMVESLYIGWFRPWFNGKLQAVPTIFSGVPVQMADAIGPTESYLYHGGDTAIDRKRAVPRSVVAELHVVGGCEQKYDKRAASFRLSDECLDLLKELADNKGISQSAVIELAIRDEMKKHERKSK